MRIALKIVLLFSYFTLYRSFRKSPAEAEEEEDESDEIVEKKIAEEIITEEAIPEKAIVSEDGT